MKIHRADVLVIGGGPAGATAAFQLASAGIGVTLVDRARFPRDKVCGESLSPGAIARLRAIGMWPAVGAGPESPLASMPVRGMKVRSPRGTTFSGAYRDGADGTGIAIRRTVLDHSLLERARARGARIVEAVEVTRGEVTPDGGAAIFARDTGGKASLRYEAKRVIVADGRRSFLARQLGFIEPENLYHERRRFAVRAHCEGVTGLSDFAEMEVGRGGYCGIAPLSASRANVCYVLFTNRLDIAPATIERDFRRHLEGFPGVAHRLIQARIEGAIRVVGPLRLRSKRQVNGPFLACGDTTGFLDPFTGEGIAHAIATGIRAAAAAGESLQGRPGALREYERYVRSLRRIKGTSALLLYGLVSRHALADTAAAIFTRVPRLGDAVVRLFGDQV